VHIWQSKEYLRIVQRRAHCKGSTQQTYPTLNALAHSVRAINEIGVVQPEHDHCSPFWHSANGRNDENRDLGDNDCRNDQCCSYCSKFAHFEFLFRCYRLSQLSRQACELFAAASHSTTAAHGVSSKTPHTSQSPHRRSRRSR